MTSKENVSLRPSPNVSQPEAPRHVQEWAQEKVSALREADLPTTQQITGALSSTRESDLMKEAKDLPLSETAQRVFKDTDDLLRSTERLLSEKSKHGEVQEMIKHGAMAAEKLQASTDLSKSISDTFGAPSGAASEDIQQTLSQKAQGLMHVMLQVTRMLVSAPEFRSILQHFANITSDYLKAISNRYTATWEGHKKESDKLAKQRKKEFREAMDKLHEPVQAVAKRLQDNPTVHEGVQNLLDLFIHIRDRTAEALMEMQEEAGFKASEAKRSKEGQEIKHHLDMVAEKAQQLVANFGGSLEPLWQAMDAVVGVMNREKPEFDDIISQFQDLLAHPAEWEQRGSAVLEHLQALLGRDSGVYHSFQTLIDESTSFLSTFREDRTVHEVEDSLSRLIHDLFLDEHDQPKLKTELLSDLQRVMPILLRRLYTFPVGRIDYSSDEFDFICDNFVINCIVLPKRVTVKTETYIALDVENVTNTAIVELRNIRLVANNLVYYYYKKTFPSLADVGIADLKIGERGLDIDLTLQPSPSEDHFLRVVDVKSTIHDLELDIKRTQHEWLITVFRPLVNSAIHARLEDAIKEAMKMGLEKLDESVAAAVKAPMAQGKSLASEATKITTLLAGHEE